VLSCRSPFGLWTDSVIRDLFTRADWLGYAALTALADRARGCQLP
jgi:uncharacterized membrane protein YcjF (UPF0283 family)